MTTTLEPKEVKPDTFRVTFRHGKPLRLLADGLSREEFYAFEEPLSGNDVMPGLSVRLADII